MTFFAARSRSTIRTENLSSAKADASRSDFFVCFVLAFLFGRRN